MKSDTVVPLLRLAVSVSAATDDWYPAAVAYIEKARAFAKRADKYFQSRAFAKVADNMTHVSVYATKAQDAIFFAVPIEMDSLDIFDLLKKKAINRCGKAFTGTGSMTDLETLTSLYHSDSDINARIRTVKIALTQCRRYTDKMARY